MHCAEDEWQILSTLFVLGRLTIELNHNPLLETNVVLTLHYAKIMESWDNGSPIWVLLENNLATRDISLYKDSLLD